MKDPQALLEVGDMEKMDQSVKYVHDIIKYEISRGIDPQRIFLMGFSCGGAAALRAGLTAKVPLGGIIGLSTFFAGAVPDQMAHIPVHLYHGDTDCIVPASWAHHTHKVLQAAGVNTSLKTYPGLGHFRSREQADDVVAVLQEVLCDSSTLSERVPKNPHT
jgi:phospholipase/carboxylesterase